MAGFSLIEVLISMVLALITFLIMFQMFESWDRNKRSTASGGGAMITGALGMFRLERDLRLSGFGFGSASELGCTVRVYDVNRPNQLAAATGSAAVSATSAGVYSFTFSPLIIVDGSGAPDQIVTLYGSSEGVAAGRFFGTASAGAQSYTGATANNITMDIGALGGIQQGDLAVVAQDGGSCDLVEVTNNLNSDRRTFDFGTANYSNTYTGNTTTSPRYNDSSGITVSGAPSGHIYVLGPLPQRRVWQVRNGRTLAFTNDLNWTDAVNNTTGAAVADGANDVTDIADNIVNLQAQYGFTGTAAGSVCSASATPTWTKTTPGTTDRCLWNFLWAVRVAVLARSDQFEKTWGVPINGTSAVAPQWAGGSFVMTNIDGTADSFTSSTAANPSRNPNDWRHYRYRVFEAMIPIKNIMWAAR